MQILKRGDAKYQQVVAPWNGAVTSNPDEVLYCTSTHDVQQSLARARQFNIPIALKSGGHSAAGFSSIEGGMLLSLRGLNSVSVDPQETTVTVGGGALWGEVDRETQRYGLATPGCFISSVGVAGPLQSGGVSRLIRRYGLIADQLLSAQVVLADGSLVMVSDLVNSDLFWALRGGGIGNFGVITQMKLRVHPLRQVRTVTLVYPAEQMAATLHEMFLRTKTSPRTLAWHAIVASPSFGPFPQELWGKPVLFLSLASYESDPHGQRILQTLGTIGKPSVKREEAVSYSALQKSTDDIAPAGKHWFMRSEWLRDLDDAEMQALIGTMVDRIHHATSPDSQIILHQVDGAMADVSADATPFAFRGAHYFVEIIGGSESESAAPEQLEWCHTTWHALTPWSAAIGGNPAGPLTATHLAHLGIGEGPERVQGAFGRQAWQRLRRIKSQYDPTNMFSHTPTISPTEKEDA